MFRPKSSVTSLNGRFTPLGAKDRKNLRQQFLSQFKHKTADDFDLICPTTAQLSIYSVKGVTCDIYISDSVPIFITHSSKKKNSVLIPTVFTLWKLPDLLPRMVCQEPAFGYICRGADFMIPGLVNRKQIEHLTLTGEYIPLPVKTAPKETEEEPETKEPQVKTTDNVEESADNEEVAATNPEDSETVNPEPLRYHIAPLEEGQFWSLGCLGHEVPFAVGEVAMDFDQFRTAEKGKVLMITHVIGDLLYKLCPSNKCDLPPVFQVISDPALESLIASNPSEAPEAVTQPPAPGAKGAKKESGSKNAVVSKPLKQISAYQPLNNVKELLATRIGESGKSFYTMPQLSALLDRLMQHSYQKSLEFPSLNTESAPEQPPPVISSLPDYAEIVAKDQILNNLCFSKKERQQLKEGNGGTDGITNNKVLQTFVSQGFKKLTILAPEGPGDVCEGAMIIEGDAAITISVKKTKRFVRTQVANIHKFSNIDPKQLAERLQKACAAAATVAEMEDVKGNPLGVLVQGSVAHECQKFINKTYGIPMDMILIN